MHPAFCRPVRHEKTPSPAARRPPLPHFVGERKPSFGDWRFLSPGQGERWFAKRTGEGVLSDNPRLGAR
jgi:hypothetical protein